MVHMPDDKITGTDKIIQLLTDIWHNQATMIKWLEKNYEATRKNNKTK